MSRFAPGTDFSLYYVDPRGGRPRRKDSEEFRSFMKRREQIKKGRDKSEFREYISRPYDKIPSKRDIVDDRSADNNSATIYKREPIESREFLSARGAGVGGMDKSPVNEDRKKLFMKYLQEKMPEKYNKRPYLRIPDGYPAGYRDEELSNERKEGLRSIMSSLKESFASLRNKYYPKEDQKPGASFEEMMKKTDAKVDKYDELLEKLGVIKQSSS